MADTTQKLLDGSKDLTNNIANTGSQLYGEASSIASNTLSTSMNTITDSVNIVKETSAKYLNNISSVSYAIFGLIIVSALVGYGLYTIITDKITYQQRITISGTEAPILCNQITEFKILQSLDNSNGNKRTFAFWIYINDINKYSGQYRHIAHIGDSAKKINSASPYIFLDKTSNKIYFRFSPTTDTLPADNLLNNVDSLETLNNTNNCVFTIQYVPIQRWVHIAVSINDNNKGIIYIYVDGELIDVIENKNANTLNISELNLKSKGDLFVGGDINDSANGITGFSGLLSKFTIFNQDMNQNDIYKEYNAGPFSGILTKLGLSSYGIRNPVYKINSANN